MPWSRTAFSLLLSGGCTHTDNDQSHVPWGERDQLGQQLPGYGGR